MTLELLCPMPSRFFCELSYTAKDSLTLASGQSIYLSLRSG